MKNDLKKFDRLYNFFCTMLFEELLRSTCLLCIIPIGFSIYHKVEIIPIVLFSSGDNFICIQTLYGNIQYETIVRETKIADIQDQHLMDLISEVRQFTAEFNNKKENMDSFFNRKSLQYTLSVVQCCHNDEWLYYKGINHEVSLPSGTLCAERLAIGNARSNNLELHRKDFKRIAVIDPTGDNIGRSPCGVCDEWLQKIQEESPEFCIITFPDNEFESIYEHLPANYPVEDVDSEQTQKKLEQQWQCGACDAMNIGYSTGASLRNEQK